MQPKHSHTQNKPSEKGHMSNHYHFKPSAFSQTEKHFSHVYCVCVECPLRRSAATLLSLSRIQVGRTQKESAQENSLRWKEYEDWRPAGEIQSPLRHPPTCDFEEVTQPFPTRLECEENDENDTQYGWWKWTSPSEDNRRGKSTHTLYTNDVKRI